MYLLNAIPGSLVPKSGMILRVVPVWPNRVREAVQSGRCQSAIGHADTAAIISKMVEAEVPMARVNVPELQDGDKHLLALYRGPRLPEGATTLPEEANLSFYLLQASDPECFADRIYEQACSNLAEISDAGWIQ